jgi:DHA1 family tetracycline resistance protein-like MFS transporter
LVSIFGAFVGFVLLAWSFAPNVIIFLIIMILLACSGGILSAILNSVLTKAVYQEEVGGTLGLSASLESLTRQIAPSQGGYLLEQVGRWTPGVVASLIMVWVSGFAWRRLFVNPDPPLLHRSLSVSGKVNN